MEAKLRINNNSIEIAGVDNLDEFYPVHWNRKKTIAQVSTRHLPEVLRKFRGIDETNADSLPEAVKSLFWEEIYARRRIEDLMVNGPVQPPFVNKNLTLMRHQQLGREIAAIRDRYCFFFDTRTGKTPLSLAIINDDIQRHPDHKWLVVCPLILIDNAWIPDAKQFVPNLKIVNCHASTKQKRLKAINSEANIYVTNIESFVTYSEYFKGFHGCFVDESSVLKSNKSKQSKAMVEFAHTLERFYLLSGTPAPNGQWEYFMQLRAIDYFSMPQSYTKFKERYFVNVSYNPQFEKLQLRGDREEELMSQIKKYAIYVDKEDVLTTPGRTFIEVPIKMPDNVADQYRLLKNKLYAEVDGKQITAASAAAKLNKLNQVSSGFIIDTQAVKENAFYDDENQKEWYLLNDYRFKRLDDLLRNECRDQQVLIWANYRKEFELISEMLGDRCRCVYGGTSIQDKTDAIRAFKSGNIQYLVANPASADKGLTLTNCHICIYFSLNWSYELYKQSMERIYGDIRKQPDHCYYYVILAEHTVDESLYRTVLQGKGDASMAMLEHLKGGL